MRLLKVIKHKWLLFTIIFIICTLILCCILPPICFSLSKKRIEETVDRMCGFEHFSVQVSKDEPSSANADCGFLTQEVDLKGMVGNPVYNCKVPKDGMEYKFELTVSGPDKNDSLVIKVYVIRDKQIVGSSLKEHAFIYNGNLFIATINTYLYDVGKAQIAEMIEQIVQMDPKFQYYVTYNSFFS